jgi:flagellar hook-associated protein 1 FlgK
MSSLLSLLSLGSAGISAQGTGVAVATNNVANVNTAGYSRQRVDLEALAASPLVGGVRSAGVDRLGSNLLDNRLRNAAGALAMARAFANAHTDLEARLVDRGPSVDERVAGLMSRLQQVSAAPTDTTLRTSAVDAANDLAASIRERAVELEATGRETSDRIRDNITAANDLARQLAQANLDVARTNDPALRDQRERIATKLGELVGGSGRVDGDGQMRFVLDGGAVLVDGQHPATLDTNGTNITIGNRDVTGAMRGSLGADVQFRDGTLARATSDLDQLAYDLANTMNAAHTANTALDGTTGHLMFATPTSLVGAAKNLAVDSQLAGDPKLLAVGTGGGVGDNRGVAALVQAAEPLATRAIDFMSKIATTASHANADVQRDTLVHEHLAGLRDSIAGVDIEEELANLARFEHASAAMTKFVSTIDDMLGDLIDRL